MLTVVLRPLGIRPDGYHENSLEDKLLMFLPLLIWASGRTNVC